MSDESKVRSMLAAADQMSVGVPQVELVEAAVRLADTVGDKLLKFEARLDLIEAATHSGRAEKMLAAFSWCLSQYDKEPESFVSSQWRLLWHFKNVALAAFQFPSVTLPEIDGILEQMKDHYQRAGYGLRPVHYLEFLYKMEIGELDQAGELLKVWRREQRDMLADCVACEADNLMEYYILVEDWKRALQTAKPILNGLQSCLHVPHSTYAFLLKPLTKLGRVDEADALQPKGYRMIRKNPVFMKQVALHIGYLMHRDRDRAALNLVERHLDWALDSYEIGARHTFMAAAANIVRRSAERAKGNRKRTLKLPRRFPLYDESDKYDLNELADWLAAEAARDGEALDRRAGNTYATTSVVAALTY